MRWRLLAVEQGTAGLIRAQDADMPLVLRGEIDVKGKGRMVAPARRREALLILVNSMICCRKVAR
jgi:hypothetical protein